MLFEKILLPIDVNDSLSWKKTLPTAISIMQSNPNAQLWILSVIPNFGMNIVESYFPKGWTKEINSKTKEAIDKIVKEYVPENIVPNIIVGRGVVYQVILENASQLEIDLIVMSASNQGSKEYLLGPNVARVSRHADVSVLIKR